MKPTTPLDRRKLLQVGALGMAGLALPELLQADARRGSRDKSCIFVILSGGPSHIDTWDPKPDAPQEIRGPYKSIATRTPGVRVTEMFPNLAKLSPLYCLVRSLSHTEVPHVSAAHMMLTGQMDGSKKDDHPFMGSLVSRFKPTEASIPSYVWLHNMKTGTNKIPRYDNGLHLIGQQHAPLRVGYEMDNPTAPGFRVRAFDPAEGVDEPRVHARLDLLRRIEAARARTLEAGIATKMTEYQEKARTLVTGPTARRAFDLTQESDKVRDWYGRHPLGQYCLMARRLIEAGSRLVHVTGWPGLAPGETKPTVTQVWDTHDIRYTKEGDSMFENGPFGMKWSLPRLDQALSALLSDMHQRRLLEDTLVMVLGEFGRTPKFEGKGRGRGHWPHCYTGLLAGGGVRGGSVYGSSDKQGGYVATGRPISFEDFGATLFHALGIAPEMRYGPDDFSKRVSPGRPVLDLFG